MKLLFVGDVYGSVGRELVHRHLPGIIGRESIDLVVVNAENSAGGHGVTTSIAVDFFELGVDVLTSGNHIWDKREIYEYLDQEPRLLRPANYPASLPGKGMVVVRARNGIECAVLNLQGRTYMPPVECPFRKADELLAQLNGTVRVRMVDFHAELTSEKCAMGWYLDGRVSLVVGTHTHIPTADARILPRGTAYQTDAGMTGPYDSIIGAEKEAVIRKFLTSLPVRLEVAKHGAELHAVLVEVDPASGHARAIQRYHVA